MIVQTLGIFFIFHRWRRWTQIYAGRMYFGLTGLIFINKRRFVLLFWVFRGQTSIYLTRYFKIAMFICSVRVKKGVCMRFPRLKIKGKGCYYHITNHVSGPRGALPFTEEDKEMGFQIVRRLLELYCIEVISLCWMSNHFHLIVYCSGKIPSINKVVKRYNSFYKHEIYDHPPLDAKADPERCDKIASKLIDISEFMRSLQQRFTCRFNKNNN